MRALLTSVESPITLQEPGHTSKATPCRRTHNNTPGQFGNPTGLLHIRFNEQVWAWANSLFQKLSVMLSLECRDIASPPFCQT
jgi:hypothetical protein